MQFTFWKSPAGLACVCALLVACGGSKQDAEPAAPPAANAAPLASITSPAAGSTFRAGDTITYAGSASDTEDGTLAAAQLTWWAEFHHDAHSHPFLAETHVAGGSVTIPVRGETSDNVFYRFHLRATDSAGAMVEVTRDLLPQKSQITLATVPPGLALTLDGQPMVQPTVTGVVGIERDLGAAAQNFGGRRYAFASWSDGGSATHTVSTPVADTTYTATFTDLGSVSNQAPSVSLSAAATGTTGAPMTLSAAATDSDGSVARVEFFDGVTQLGEDTATPYTWSWIPATTGTHRLTARATDDQGAVTTSAAVNVTVSAPGLDTTPPTITLTAPANFATGLPSTLTVSATASDNIGVASVEFQLDGVALGAADATAPYTTSVDTSTYTAGQHLLRARAQDAAGNLSAWATATVQFGAATQPAGFTRNEAWVTALSNATAFAQAADGRFFVAEQGGALRVVKNGLLLSAPFATFAVDSSGERGLIGVALHPAFASNGFVYVYWTVNVGGVSHNRISRLTASGDVMLPGSEAVLVDLPNLSSASNHNGGAMHFGMDGKLYVGVGENATPSKAQDLTDPFGKLLRFNDDGTIPSDNPFFGSQTGLARAVWAYGLRNPFTFAVQPVTGRIHINDVGQNTWEEINVGAPKANYGWPASEGPDNVTGLVTGPLFTYKHSAASPAGSGPGGFFTGLAIAGGAFYPASGPFPAAYRSQYYFADFLGQFVGRIDLANGNAAYAFASVSGNPVDLGVGVDGAVYVLTRNSIVRVSAP